MEHYLTDTDNFGQFLAVQLDKEEVVVDQALQIGHKVGVGDVEQGAEDVNVRCR